MKYFFVVDEGVELMIERNGDTVEYLYSTGKHAVEERTNAEFDEELAYWCQQDNYYR